MTKLPTFIACWPHLIMNPFILNPLKNPTEVNAGLVDYGNSLNSIHTA